MSLKNKSILITGGTGSFGVHCLSFIFKKYKPKKVVVFSRDELKQYELSKIYNDESYPIRYFIGDVRDKNRLYRAFSNIDCVIHAAAMKRVTAAEYNPAECINTNIIGAQNVIDAAIENNVKKVIALSTDKAANPVNLYGATKLCSDKLFIAANNIKGSRDLRISVVRYGNVMGSRGSVIPFFLKKANDGILPITDPSMTRFNISLEESVNMVIWALKNCLGGELFVPILKSYKILDLAEAIGPNCKKQIVGIRSGEKVHEEMITVSDSFSSIKLEKYFAILPPDGNLLKRYKEKNIKFEMFKENTSYNSGSNIDFLTIQEIRVLISQNIDPNFTPK